MGVGNPWDGNWLWLWQGEAIGLGKGDGEEFARRMSEVADGRVTGIIVKAHDGAVGGRWMGQLRAMVPACTAAGLRVAAWGYLYGRDPAAEAARAVEALRAGAGFYVADAEAEFEKPGMGEAAAKFFFHLLDEVPDAVLGFTSFAVTNLHPRFPWTTFANHCQFAMPQVYWREIGWTVGTAWSRSWSSYVGLGRPVVPVGQAFGGVSREEMLSLAELAKRYGCTGISWWSWQHAGPEQLGAIKEAGRLFKVGKDYAGRWSEKAIERVKELGVMAGYEDGTFRPTQALTREEAAALAAKLWDAVMGEVSGCLGELAGRVGELARRLGTRGGKDVEAGD